MKKRRILSIFAAATIALSCIIMPKSENTGFDIVAGAATYDNVKTDGGLSIKNIKRNDENIAFTGSIMEGDEITLGIKIPQIDRNIDALQLKIDYNQDCLSLKEWYKNNNSSTEPEKDNADTMTALDASKWTSIWTAFSTNHGSATYNQTTGVIMCELNSDGYSGLVDSDLELEAKFTASSNFGADKYNVVETLFDLVLDDADEERTMVYFSDQKENNYVDSQEPDGIIFVWKPAPPDATVTIEATLTETVRKASIKAYSTKPDATKDIKELTGVDDLVVYKRDNDGKKLEPNKKDTIDLFGIEKTKYDFKNKASMTWDFGTMYITQNLAQAKSKKKLKDVKQSPIEFEINPTSGPTLVIGSDQYFMLDLKQWCKYANFTDASDIHYYDDFRCQKPIVITENSTDKTKANSNPDGVYIWLYGDVDHDGYVGATDATLILRYLVGMSMSNNTIGTKNDTNEDNRNRREIADVTEDGEVNARDATQILRKIVDLPSVFDDHPKPKP